MTSHIEQATRPGTQTPRTPRWRRRLRWTAAAITTTTMVLAGIDIAAHIYGAHLVPAFVLDWSLAAFGVATMAVVGDFLLNRHTVDATTAVRDDLAETRAELRELRAAVNGVAVVVAAEAHAARVERATLVKQLADKLDEVAAMAAEIGDARFLEGAQQVLDEVAQSADVVPLQRRQSWARSNGGVAFGSGCTDGAPAKPGGRSSS